MPAFKIPHDVDYWHRQHAYNLDWNDTRIIDKWNPPRPLAINDLSNNCYASAFVIPLSLSCQK
jgi:hypothetical protein